ncbi:hypothetical protein A2U01_0086339, partial [Trifolium medium]|nr:hypothetical protein [Trifolium medium]
MGRRLRCRRFRRRRGLSSICATISKNTEDGSVVSTKTVVRRFRFNRLSVNWETT